MACLDHVCRSCGHGWMSSTDDTNCELCGSSHIQMVWDDWDWEDEARDDDE